MTTFKESGLIFDFDQHWDILQFDKEKDYKKVCDKVLETKSVDFLGKYGNTLWFFEVKSFKSHGKDVKVKARLENNMENLTTEIAQKVRDTLACLLGGARNSTHNKERWENYCLHIHDNINNVKIVVWVEQDLSQGIPKSKRKKTQLQIANDKLKQKLSWLTSRTMIKSTKEEHNIPALEVKLEGRT